MVTIEVSANFSDFANQVRQIPFATALALTRTAQDIQAEVIRDLPKHFTIRNSWVAKGIRIERAEKKNLEARVTVRDDFMRLQELGGTKPPTSGAHIAIPGDVGTKTGIVRQEMRPNALRGKKGVFRATIAGIDGLWQRLQRRSKAKKAAGHTLKLLFIFKSSVPIAPRFEFFDTCKRVAIERFPRQLDIAKATALKTAR